MGKLRLGIVGCGGMAASHMAGYKLLGDMCEVTAVCDIDETRARRAAEATGAAFHTTDYREIAPHIDCVLIVLPHHLHFESGMYFLGQGKHVLMEKPLCNTEAECVALADEADARGLTLMCAYPVRYWDGIQLLKSLLDSGEYGEIFQMSIWTEQYTDTVGKEWVASAETLGGGQLFSHGCHYIDLLLWFLGDPVSGVHVGSKKGTPWMVMEGNSNVIITFANGAMGYHFGTWGARGTTHGYDFQVFTDKGFFDYRMQDERVVFKCNLGPDVPAVKEVVWQLGEHSKQTHHETRHFLECVNEKKKPLTDARSATQGLRVIWRLYEAERKNEIADLRGLGLE